MMEDIHIKHYSYCGVTEEKGNLVINFVLFSSTPSSYWTTYNMKLNVTIKLSHYLLTHLYSICI
jgi:hypothetical protein